MALAMRSVGYLCKISNGNKITAFSTLQRPLERGMLVRAVRRSFLSNPKYAKPAVLNNFPKFYSSAPEKSILNQFVETNKPKLEDEIKKQEEELKQDEEERKRQWEWTKRGFILFGGSITIMSSLLLYQLSRPDQDLDGKDIEDEFSNLPFFQQSYKRIIKSMFHYKKVLQDPHSDKLLPDPVKPPYVQPPYTVVLDLKGTLIHPDWTYQTGWRFKKRPGVDQFLEAMFYTPFEVVIYSADTPEFGHTITNVLDPHGYIMYKLFRDSTRFVDGKHMKHLDSLNRDMSKVIVVHWDDETVQHPDNLLKIPHWNGNDDDHALLDLAAFLKTIYTSKVDDVRDVLNNFKGYDDPLDVFRENQRKFLMQLEEQEQQAQKMKQQDSKVKTMTWRPSFLQNN